MPETLEVSTTIFIPLRQFCRVFRGLSQQLGEDLAHFFGICVKSPYPFALANKQNACHCKQETRSLTIKNYKIMAQKNEMSARALSMEELENVNGGNIFGFIPRIKTPKPGIRCIKK